ncbi:MAG: asparaginase domain-containing protein, partial [Pontibacterium sp.]
VGAVLLAANRAAAEVCIYFGGKLLRGNRSTKVHTTDLAAFDSPNCDPLATLNIYMSANRHMALSPLVRAFSLPDYDPNHVVVLSLFPGIQASMLAAIVENTNPTGIVLESYGVGNVPDEDAALMALIERESNAGRIFINRTQCSKGRVYQGAYATGAVLNSMGVVSAGDMTREAAFTKLHHLIASGLSASEVRNKMGTSLCGELTE